MTGLAPRNEPIDFSQGPVALGRHVLLSTLGRGGMSVVYAGYDEALDRKVAIKVLRSGGPLRRVRLRREAQALAQLTHPNVVRVYEICTHEQIDYIVMELVEGVTLSTWCRDSARDHHEILAVYLAAGRGLAAAHAKDIVHRDFKPDNAMVRTSDGQVLVMDFGLARDDRGDADASGPIELDLDADADPDPDPNPESTEPGSTGPLSTQVYMPQPRPGPIPGARRDDVSHVLTRVGAVMGTVGYMAPEQVRGRAVDARSDQFSFCVSLWEALYGARPFEDGNTLEVYREALLSNRPPTAARHDVPGWLRAVLERGLARNPLDRFPSMLDLLDALEADPTRGRRRKLAVAATLFATFATIGVVWGVDRYSHGQKLALCDAEVGVVEQTWNPDVVAGLERTFEATEHPVAASAWKATHTWLDAYARELGQLRRDNCVAATVDDTRTDAGAALVEACLTEGQANFDALVEVLMRADSGMIQQAAEAASTLPLLADCLDERRQTNVLRPPVDLQDQLHELQARLLQAEAREMIGEHEPALVEAEAILAEADAIDWAPLSADALLLISDVHSARYRDQPAELAAHRSFRKAAVAGDSIRMLEAAVRLTGLTTQSAQLDAAEGWRETANELIDSAELETSLIAGTLAVTEARLETTRGNLDQALAHIARGLTILEDQLGPTHPGIGPSLAALAQVHNDRNQYEEARAVNERRLDIYLAAYGPDSVKLIQVYNAIGGSLHTTNNAVQAREYYLLALGLVERVFGPEDPEAGSMHCNLGLLELEAGRPDVARPSFERCIAILQPNYPEQHPILLKPLVNLGTISSRLGEHEVALAYFRRSLEVLAAVSDTGADERHVWVRSSYADALVRSGDLDRAHVEYGLALAAAEQTHGSEAAQVIRPLIGLAEIELERGTMVDAEAHLERAQALIHKQTWRAWELEFALAQRTFAGDRTAGVAEIRQLRARFVAEAASYSIAEVDVWLARHELSPEPD